MKVYFLLDVGYLDLLTVSQHISLFQFFDTADRYGDGRSERLLARFCREHGGDIHIATKIGRRLDPHVAAGYTAENIEGFIDRSLTNLEVESLELVQLHCPPTTASTPWPASCARCSPPTASATIT